jgi:hypothetical protein
VRGTAQAAREREYKQGPHAHVVEGLKAVTTPGHLNALVTKKTLKAESHLPAQQFVTRFCANIVPAIENQDRAATIQVMKALQHGGSSTGEPDLVNGFETVLAVAFLDPTVVTHCWNSRTEGISRAATL